MRVLVCGGRDFTDFAKVCSAMNGIVRELDDIDMVIHGAAKGADTLGGDWAEAQKIPVEVYPADWEKNGRAAGYIRNRQMLIEGKPDLVVAFPGGKGTAMMIDIARLAGVKVIEVK